MIDNHANQSMLTVAATPLDAAISTLTLPSPGTTLTPQQAKDLAVLFALRGLGKVAPNPLVGAVIVDVDHRFVAAGAHEQVGEAHAEVMALRSAALAGLTGSLGGGTMYVTLEPCAHANRTPACAPQVAASGIKRVIYGVLDPNPKVSGRGAEIIRTAGISCEHDPQWQDACTQLAEVFLWNIRHSSPFVGLKVATSADGVMARRGDSRAWITGPRARAYGHFLRVYYDAILIGCGTLLADDPKLDPRDSLWPGRAPQRIVIDPDGRALKAKSQLDWRLLEYHPEHVHWIVSDKPSSATEQGLKHLQSRGANIIQLPVDAAGTFAPNAVLEALWQRGMTSVLLEGGLGVYGPFLQAGAVNRLHLFQAPKLLGGHNDAMYFGHACGYLGFARTNLVALGRDWLIDANLDRAR